MKTQVKSDQRINAEKEGNGNQIVLVKLEEWEDKRRIKTKKKELERGTYLDDDITWKKKNTKKTKRESMGTKKKGKFTKVGYIMICIEGRWQRCDERNGNVREEEERRI